jgi:hypothetical protein
MLSFNPVATIEGERAASQATAGAGATKARASPAFGAAGQSSAHGLLNGFERRGGLSESQLWVPIGRIASVIRAAGGVGGKSGRSGVPSRPLRRK